MIKFNIPIRGIDDSITRPVSLGILNDIKNILYVNKDIRTKLSNQIDSFITNEQWNPIKLEDNSPKMEDIKFSVNENVRSESLITTSNNYNDYKAILHDTDIDAFIRPIYVESEIEFTIKYRSRSKTSANNLINMLKLNIIDNETMTLHNIEYMFYIPSSLLELFLDISRLKHNVIQDDSNYEDYLINNSDGRLSMVGGLDGTTSNMNIVVKEKQRDIVGYFEDSIIDVKSEYDDSNGTWEAELSYKITYNKPTALTVFYPPLIYNQLLPKKYLILKNNRYDANRESSRTYIGEIDKPFTNGYRLDAVMGNQINDTDFISIPNFDNYKPSLKQPYLIRTFSLLLSITNDDKRTLFNLNELPEYDINPLFIEFIRTSEWSHICTRYKSIFYLELLENGKFVKDGILNIDENLNVYSNIDLDLTKTYRVMFNICSDTLILDSRARLRLINNENILNTVLTALDVNDVDKLEYLKKDEKIKIYDGNKKSPMYTVMINQILVYKK